MLLYAPILPPLVVLVLGFATRRVALSISAGILIAAAIARDFAPLPTCELLVKVMWQNTEIPTVTHAATFWDSWNIFINLFLLCLGVLVTLLHHCGGAYAYRRLLGNGLSSRRAESASALLSTSLFIDDYFSSLTVGTVMQPVADAAKVPRVKQSFLVDSLAAPLAILCPFSSWVAAIVGFLRDNGIHSEVTPHTHILASPLGTYFMLIPFMLYSLILASSVWMIVWWRWSFGPMRQHEILAQQTGNLFGGKPPPVTSTPPPSTTGGRTNLLDFFLPIGMLLGGVLVGMLWTGHWSGFGGQHGFVQALQHTHAAAALWIGGSLALGLCVLYLLATGGVTIRALPAICKAGCGLMFPAIVVLFLSWTLGDLLRHELQMGAYFANLLSGELSPTLLPCLLFILSTLIAFMLGSSWGTAAIVFPFAISMTLQVTGAPTQPELLQVPLILPVLGAVLSGCVAGDHISPLSDTSVMSAASCQVDLMQHVQTQLVMSGPVLIATCLSLLSTPSLLQYGLVVAAAMSLGIGLVISWALLWGCNRFAH